MNTDKLSKYGETLLLWLLCTVCISAAVCIYMNTVINIWSVMGAVISALVILFADFARKKKLGGLLYVAVLICVGFVPGLLIADWHEMFQFVRWFFSGSEAVETQTSFILVLTLMMSFLFTSAAYYFTRIIYRSSVVTLITLIPFAIAVKTATSLPYGYAAVVAALNIIFFIYNARKNVTEGGEARGRATLTVYADYAIAVILLALIIPKPSVTPYYDKFEEMTNNFQFGGTGENRFTGEYKTSAGITDELRRGESVLIYIVNSPAPVYLKTQVFDIYNNAEGLWTEAEDMTGNKKWQDTAPLINYEMLGNAIENLTDDDELAARYNVTETQSYASIYAQSFPAVYVPAPLRVTGLALSNVSAKYSARTKKGEIFTNNKLLPENASYTIRYYTEDIFEQLISNGACDVTAEEYGSVLDELYSASEDDTEEQSVIESFRSVHLEAMEYADKTVTEISPEIRALAEEITAGMEYDYQKAEAIEQYFYNNGFLYDLMYEAPEGENTPEYFLFESRRGICSDFATAYILLARAAGLNARYVEGFVMQDSKTTPDTYYIYTDNAHAYPEVYIPGAGWVVYEPTTSTILSAGERESGEEERTDPLAIVFTAIIAIVVTGVFILLIIFMPKILEAFFRIRVRASDNGKAVIMLYNRHAANMERKFESSCKAFTPEQLNLYTTEKTLLGIESLAEPFIKVCYGGMKITDTEKNEAFGCYKAQYKALKKIRKGKD